MFITEAMAATEAAGTVTESNPVVALVVQLILVFAIFYFLLIRPQKKKMEERDTMLNSILPKDEIITGGGVYAKVVKINGDVLTVEIANGITVNITRSSVREVVSGSRNIVK